MVSLLLQETEVQLRSVIITMIPYKWMGYNLFISHKACLLVLDSLSQKAFGINSAVNSCYIVILRWHRTVQVWLHHKIFNAYFSKSTINNLFPCACIYKVLLYLSSPVNQIVQLCVKRKLEILGDWKNTKRIHNSITLNFGLTTIYLPIYKWAVSVFPLAFSFQECSISGSPSSLSNFF